MMHMDRDKRVMLRLTENEHKLLKLEALERNMSMSTLIRQAVKIYIEKFNVRNGNGQK